jgi:hypothetical protein
LDGLFEELGVVESLDGGASLALGRIFNQNVALVMSVIAQKKGCAARLLRTLT